MRVNVYAEEMTDKVEIISKSIEGTVFTGLRFYLELPVTVPVGDSTVQCKGPFLHRPGDDDSSAITFWGKRDLRGLLQKGIAELDTHYGTTTALSTATTELPKIGERWPNQGGLYMGICGGEDGAPDYHLILADDDGEFNDMQWDAALEKCKGYSAEGHDDFSAPTRREQALCYANGKQKFQSTYYWSSEQYSADYAWY
ncbi:MAG: hypothetical protein ACRETC_12175, partial [Gammaproteobacteria bacterium]